ncbi:MAG: DUF1513 domain-containing protein [Rhodovulum sulfidophilum]|uniref:DUF1513 domain-containing protein n=1 Tax=Rhodovulum sulfidophilum TaxID=35806 RepID=A0A2W5QLR7_RHOSU|nr:MAG: DUF1513 domain-containing protein [Rhodovulum sulfidophilum]
MTTRRGFLRILGAASAGAVVPSLSWADLGAPAYIAAARRPDGAFALFGVDAEGEDLFSVELPDRAHSTALHPKLARAVVFARRPGTYAIVFDCATGRSLRQLDAAAGSVFCGHGAFSPDGKLLYTSEAEIDTGEGLIGIWDVAAGFRRLGAMSSGGIGPHEILMLPDGMLAVANGALENGPDGRPDPIALQEMEPNLTYIDLATREIQQVVALSGPMRRNSIRHLAVRPDGLLAFAMQWHGADTEAPALLGLHRRGEAAPTLLTADGPAQFALKGYAGSVAFSGDGARVAISSPIGGLVDVFDAETGAHAWRCPRPDVCGLAPSGPGFVANTGAGDWLLLDRGGPEPRLTVTTEPGRAWDNHMMALRG